MNNSDQEKKCPQCKLENNKGICDRKDCINSTPPQHEEWRLRFDEEFVANDGRFLTGTQTVGKAKKFISSLLKQREEKTIRNMMQYSHFGEAYLEGVENYAEANGITLQEPNKEI